MLVVDDALLLDVLAGVADRDVQGAAYAGEIFTTHSWYWRLARALHDDTSTGALSRRFNDLEPDPQARVLAAIERFPAEIGLMDSRQLVPVMATLDVSRRPNLLHAEAAATALLLGATVTVTTESGLLTDMCRELGIPLRLVT